MHERNVHDDSSQDHESLNVLSSTSSSDTYRICEQSVDVQ